MNFLNKMSVMNRPAGRGLLRNSWCLLMLLLFCSFFFSTASAADGSFGVAVELPERMRGISTSDKYLQPDLFKLLEETDVNVIRLGFSIDNANASAPTEKNPLAPYKDNLAILDRALPLARKAGIKIILCAAETYGWNKTVFTSGNATDLATYRTNLVNFWVAMAQRYLDEPAIVAYDVLNEPVTDFYTSGAWYADIMPEAVEAIRSVNTNVWLVIETENFACPEFRRMPLLTEYTRVIYSFHHYAPGGYASQSDNVAKVDLTSYWPGPNSMWGDPPYTYWDKEALRTNPAKMGGMSSAISFAETNPNIRILIGEFGLRRWAPGAEKWLEDSIALFEEYGWDWCNHSPSGWNGFNMTYSADKDTDWDNPAPDGGYRDARWQALTKGWSLNRTDQNR